MLWYAIQSYTGKEEQLTKMIRRVVPERYYGECFVPYFERLRCWRQQNQVHILRLFPGYLFISTDNIEAVFQCLKRVPAMSKILAAGAFEFTPLYDSEAEFLEGILDADHIVRLTYAATDGKGRVTYLSGPLEKCGGRIHDYKFRDRYAQVRLTIAGQEKTVRMGIILNDDVRREMAYGKVEAHIPTPEKYVLGNTSTDPLTLCPHGNGKPAVMLQPGDRVAVINGAFEGIVTVIREVRNNMVSIVVHMFDREMPVELSVGEVRKLEAGGNVPEGGYLKGAYLKDDAVPITKVVNTEFRFVSDLSSHNC